MIAPVSAGANRGPAFRMPNAICLATPPTDRGGLLSSSRFVLVGHSISGLYLRSYAAHYPGDLAGLVFVDGATPLQDDRIPKELVKIQEDQRRQMPWQKLLMMLGWYRLRGRLHIHPSGL